MKIIKKSLIIVLTCAFFLSTTNVFCVSSSRKIVNKFLDVCSRVTSIFYVKSKKRLADSKRKKAIKVVKDEYKLVEKKQVESSLPFLRRLPFLQQKNDWQCGYFATFGGIQMHEAAQNNNDAIASLNMSGEIKNFETWETTSLKKWEQNSEYKDLMPKEETELNTSQIESLLSLYFNKEKFADIENISVIEVNVDDLYFTQAVFRYFLHNIIKNIHNLRNEEKSQPQLLIVISNKHWVAFEIVRCKKSESSGNKSSEYVMYMVNSLYNPTNEYKFVPKMVIENLYKFFVYEKLPSSEDFTRVKEMLQATNSSKDKSNKKQQVEKAIDIAQKANFSQEQFSLMLKHYGFSLKNPAESPFHVNNVQFIDTNSIDDSAQLIDID